MSHADGVREYCYNIYILPAKNDNLTVKEG
ncbi:MAG: hypothetical protein ACI8WB_000158 [Phenylobacterium sp.]|jgi:hypothetical protein